MLDVEGVRCAIRFAHYKGPAIWNSPEPNTIPNAVETWNCPERSRKVSKTVTLAKSPSSKLELNDKPFFGVWKFATKLIPNRSDLGSPATYSKVTVVLVEETSLTLCPCYQRVIVTSISELL